MLSHFYFEITPVTQQDIGVRLTTRDKVSYFADSDLRVDFTICNVQEKNGEQHVYMTPPKGLTLEDFFIRMINYKGVYNNG